MCRFIDIAHTYEECKLQEVEENDQDDEPQTLTPMARLLRRLTTGWAQEQADRALAPPPPPLHIVIERQIVQCPNAVDNEEQIARGVLAKDRQCLDPVPLVGTEEPAVPPQPSELRGICPVCEAAETAIREASNKTTIVSMHYLRRQIELIECRSNGRRGQGVE
jgi:hypothetical protein